TVAKGFGSDRWDRAQILVHSMKTGERRVLINGGSHGRYIPTAHIIYVLGGSLFAIPFDLAQLTVRSGRRTVVGGISPVGPGASHLSISATGSLAYIPLRWSRSELRLAWIDRDGTVEPLELPLGTYEFPRVAADGRRIAYDTDDGKETVVWIYELSGSSAPRRLTFGGQNRVPVWSPDGEYVAFQSDHDGDMAIFRQRADGTGQAERLTTPAKGALHMPDAWSPDGRTLLLEVTKESRTSLWTLSLPDKIIAPITGTRSQVSTSGAFSPDGRWLAYVSSPSRTGPFFLFVQPFPPTGAVYQVTNAARPLWATHPV